jgi:hypothetical protein
MEAIAIFIGYSIIILVILFIGSIIIGVLGIYFFKLVYKPFNLLLKNYKGIKNLNDEQFEEWLVELRNFRKTILKDV